MNIPSGYTEERTDEYGETYEALVQCPKCQSRDISEYIYGDLDPASYEEAEKPGSKIIPAGCIIDLASPSYRCNTCLTDY